MPNKDKLAEIASQLNAIYCDLFDMGLSHLALQAGTLLEGVEIEAGTRVDTADLNNRLPYFLVD